MFKQAGHRRLSRLTQTNQHFSKSSSAIFAHVHSQNEVDTLREKKPFLIAADVTAAQYNRVDNGSTWPCSLKRVRPSEEATFAIFYDQKSLSVTVRWFCRVQPAKDATVKAGDGHGDMKEADLNV